MKFKIYEAGSPANDRKYIDNGRIFTSVDELLNVLTDIYHEEVSLSFIEGADYLDFMNKFELEVEIVPQVRWRKLIEWWIPNDEINLISFIKKVKKDLLIFGTYTIDLKWIKQELFNIPASICEGFEEFLDPWDDEYLDPKNVEIIDVPGEKF